MGSRTGRRDARVLFRQRGRGLGSGIEDRENGLRESFLGIGRGD